MTIALNDLESCFEGVIPSVISTVSSTGVPNISYLSHVVQVDNDHIALSNQFFGKTGTNLRAVPRATILLIDGLTGAQYRVETLYVRSETSGPVFERVASHLIASSAQVGMADVMLLRAVDIFRVITVVQVPSETQGERDQHETGDIDIRATARIGTAISEATELGEVIDALLDGLMRELRCHAASVLLSDTERGVVTTIGSRGYGRTGIGSEIGLGEGVIGTAAARQRIVKVSDLSRIQRFGSAVQAGANDEHRERSIALPGLVGAMSQLAQPIIFQRRLIGVIFVESRQRMAFGSDVELLFEVISRLAGAAILNCDFAVASEPIVAPSPPSLPMHAATIKVVHHAYDDSVFIEDFYVIKGLAGRLLLLILERHLKEGRIEFTNRELRLSEDMRLPDFKDNLETRLLLLRRRLDEKEAPIRLLHVGRGQMRLILSGRPAIQHV